MLRIITAYAATLIAFLAIDMVWLTQAGPYLYQPVLGPILAPNPRFGAIIAFYALYAAGLVYFAVMPGLTGGGRKAVLIKGAIFGFLAYATYDLTNQATLVIWSTTITIADMGWGAFVSAMGSFAGYECARRVKAG